MNSSTDTIVLFSGGIDSAACAHYLKERSYNIRGLFVNYGQKAALLEQAAAERLSAFLEIKLLNVRVLSERLFGEGEIVGRNAFLILTAVLDKACSQSRLVAIGIHAGTAYYDCSPAFLQIIDRLVSECTDGRTRVLAPFRDWTKQDILEYAIRARLPLDQTYSCECGSVPPCGSCLSCRDRRFLSCSS